MPEIKNTFLQGKMNKDLDERLVPNGQYRHAENIEISTAEDSDIGVVKNIVGNHRLDAIINSQEMTCVASVSDEKTNKIYWFVSSYTKDAIFEYDVSNDFVLPVVVDMYAGTSKAVLKFSGNIITGINIIDNLLFWTDNNSEPKKINIDTYKKSTDASGDKHTQLIFENGSFDALTVNSIYPESPNEEVKTLVGKYFTFTAEKFLKTINTWEHIPGDSSNSTVMRTNIRHYRGGKFLGTKEINFFNTTNWPSEDNDPIADNRYTADSVNYVEMPAQQGGISGSGIIPFESKGYPGNGLHARLKYNSTNFDFQVGDIIFGDNITIDLQEQHVTVIKQKPLSAFSVKINHSDVSDSKYSTPNLFETKFPRFSYRYKFEDGEVSAFAPFTQPVFNPKYTKDPSVSSETPVFYNKDNSYDIKEPQNKAMINSIHSVELTDFVTSQTPEDVKEIEILYKQEESSVIYSIGTVKSTSTQWHNISNHENASINQSITPHIRYGATGGLTCGKYLVTTENIYAALPANQLLRPWDNVPKKALAQEVTGNRIVYGNYVQNYDLTTNVNIAVNYDTRKNSFNSFETQGLPSIKSQRNYQLGVIYCDKYGRETPVFTSNNSSVYVPWQGKDGIKNASRSTQLNVSTVANFPEWVDSLKFFVKETSNEYYNLVMDRAWVTKSTYELDDSEGHLWLSFPSSDRNKISEEDYIILKKKIGLNEKQVDLENKFKVINISNEAPDAIKYQLVNLGAFSNTASDILTTGSDPLFTNSERRPDSSTTTALVDTIEIDKSSWKRDGDSFNSALETNFDANNTDQAIDTENLYISWRRQTSDNTVSSKKYKVIGGFVSSPSYILKLSTPITKADSDIAHAVGDSNVSGGMHEDLIFQVEKRILKDAEDFSGKFFVKISKNEVTGIIETGKPVNILDKFQVKAKTSSWYWQDKVGAFISTNSGSFGLMNYDGHDVGNSQIVSINGIHNAANNDEGNSPGGSGSDAGTVLKVTDYAEAWEGIENNFGPTFFVDSMHMAAGQSEASDYAKYCCITWAGCTKDDNFTAEESAWSYPPLKQWISDFGDTSNMISPGVEGISYDAPGNVTVSTPNISPESIYYENNLLSTAPGLPQNSEYEDLQIDGWVGPLQNVSRDLHPSGGGHLNANNVNGLEGFVTTSLVHSKGPRRWFSGITGGKTESGVGAETKTYADNDEDIQRHFMHFSFFAPGKDLHTNSNWDLNTGDSVKMIYGDRGFMANLQGIWGGGVFTGRNREEYFGAGSNPDEKFIHFPMEGNYDSSLNYLPKTPGPGVGFGYDTKYRELHERQWDPTFNKEEDPENRIRDFIRNLHAGARFRFNRTKTPGSSIDELIDDTVYTIKKVHVKKLYNHTSWRRPYNRYFGTYAAGTTHPYESTNISEEYQSVEEVAMRWLESAQEGSTGDGALSGISGPNGFGSSGLIKKIVDFGAAHNRRLCYVIELDKNPRFSNSALGNPLSSNVVASGSAAPNDSMNADSANDNYTDIEFLDPVEDLFLSDLSKFPAIWELDPKKQEVDLDIYYEASSSIPIKINEHTNELFAPIGCKVEIINSQNTGICILEYWDKQTVFLSPGFSKGDDNGEIDYTGVSFKFTRQDGSYTIAEAGLQDLDGGSDGFKTNFVLRENIAEVISSGLSWHNCFSFGNGVESNRIRDDFNQPFITNGVKASTITQEIYKQERRKNGLIYSGIYNSNSGVNDLNQFIMAEKITKDLNPTYGSIQKLFSRNSDLVTFCEDKVIKVLANKDALFNADGNTNLTATPNVLGQSIPFVGEYGISTNPESFSSESYRAYFTDKQRGAVLRLSKDGLTPISNAGMNDFFRDNLKEYNNLIGTYDDYKNAYNLTLTNKNFNENVLLDAFLEVGEELEPLAIGSLSRITNAVPTGTSLQYLYEPIGSPTHDVLAYESGNAFDWSPFDYNAYNLTSLTKVVHHAAIPYESLQNYIPGDSIQTSTVQVSTGFIDVQTGTTAGISFQQATYSASLPDNGNIWSPNFSTYTNDIFGTNGPGIHQVDGDIWGRTRRFQYGSYISATGSISPQQFTTNNSWPGSYGNTSDPTVEKDIIYSQMSGGGFLPPEDLNKISTCITRNKDTGNVVFDRVQGYSFIEGIHAGNPPANPGAAGFGNIPNFNNWVGGLNLAYNNFTNPTYNPHHTEVYNGDEIHITVALLCYPTYNFSAGRSLGWNIINPVIELFNGQGIINNNLLINFPSFPDQYQQANQSTQNDYEYIQSLNNNTLPGVSNSNSGVYASSSSANHHEYVNGPNSAFDYNGGKVRVFPPTLEIPELYYNTNSQPSFTINKSHAQTIHIKASFKFIDPNQQAPDGSSTQDIEAVKVIDDFRVRVRQNRNPNSNVYPNGTYQEKLTHQLWEVKSINIQKGFGVTAPHVDSSGGDPTYTSVEQFESQTTTTGANIAEVIAVPPVDVPAWTEIIHQWFTPNSWVIDQDAFSTGGGGNARFLKAHTTAAFGNNYTKNLQSGLGQNTNIAASPNVNIQYYVPKDWVGLQNPADPPVNGSPYGTGGDNYQPTGLGQHGYNFDRVTEGFNGYPTTSQANGSLVEYNNDWVYIRNAVTATGQNQAATDLEYDISNDPWTAGTWYLIDIEWDESLNTVIGDPSNYSTGASLFGGRIGLWGALPSSPVNYNYNTPISSSTAYDNAYVGNFSGGHYAMLVPVLRTEYGTPRMVLRTIFKITSDSKILDSNQAGYSPTWKDKMTLRFTGVVSPGIRVQKVITKKLNGSVFDNWVNTNGKASEWSSVSGQNNSHEVVHAFQKKHTYFKNGKLNWHVPSGSGGIHQHIWKQSFNTPQTQNAPNVSTEGWELSFTVSNNQTTDNFSGELSGYVTISDSSTASTHEGIYFYGINQEGNYLIKFNFDGDTTNWKFLRANLGFIPVDIDVFQNGSYQTTGAGIQNLLINNDTISFFETIGQGTVAQEYAISDLQLTDSRKVFLGGSAGSWSFEGFNTSTEKYIYWDIDDLNLVFLNCPPFDDYSGGLKIINTNQQVDATIKQFEKYKVRFTHSISSISTASIFIYYYNTNGYGFKISNITSLTGIANGSYDASGNPKLYYEAVVTIGELDNTGNPVVGSFWNNVNQINSSYNADLKNSFVIAVEGAQGSRLSGTVDNIEMYRIYDDSDFQDTTITFSETVNGWTSFKSFIPESGVSVSKKYFTFDNGGLYQHYVPKLNNLIYNENVKDADNYNVFYENSYDSSVTAVLNQEPSVIKVFNTLNYEGSQAQILQPNTVEEITINNSLAFVNGDISGWECQNIETDLDNGTIKEFVKKEGKWFNYIKGIQTNVLDTSKFNIQGIGPIDSISIQVSTNPGAVLTNGGSTPVPVANNTVVTGNTTVVSGGNTSGGGGNTSGGGGSAGGY